MENTNHPLHNWIPYKLTAKENEVYFEWIYLDTIKYADPFFEETIAKCKGHAYNSQPFKIVSRVENLIDWSKELIPVPLKSLIFHVSRCGSTMLSQSLVTSSENIIIPEAPIIDEVLRSDRFSLEKKNELLKAVISLLGHKRFEGQKNLIIKLDAWHIFKADYLRALFPEVPFALLFRNPVEVLKSHQKMMGMHMVPNLLPPNVFGITTEEVHELGFQQYGALVLEKYFEGFIAFDEADQNVVKLDYNKGMKKVIEKFVSFIKVDYSDEELRKMFERLERHSKNEGAVFKGDSFKEEALQVDWTKVLMLHEKFSNTLVENLEG